MSAARYIPGDKHIAGLYNKAAAIRYRKLQSATQGYYILRPGGGVPVKTSSFRRILLKEKIGGLQLQ